MKHRSSPTTVLATTVALGIVILAGIAGASNQPSQAVNTAPASSTTQAAQPVEEAPACNQIPVPFESTTVDNSYAYVGTDTITTEGVHGVDEVCAKKDGTEVSRVHISQPIAQVTSVGTKEKPVYTQPSGGGAICADGWRSYSTGRGTCSHHGGVAEWL